MENMKKQKEKTSKILSGKGRNYVIGINRNYNSIINIIRSINSNVGKR